MRATAVLAFLVCLTLRLCSHEPGKPRAQAQCKFSDGNTVRVTHISEQKTYELATDEDLLTVRGMSVPAGYYTVLPAKDLATAVPTNFTHRRFRSRSTLRRLEASA